MRLFPRRRPNVRRLERRGNLEGLRAALRYSETVVDEEGEWDIGAPIRVEAAEKLSRFYGPVVTQGLVEALGDPHEAVRVAAVEGLARVGVPSGIDELLEAAVLWDDPRYGAASEKALATLTAWEVPGLPERCADLLLEDEVEGIAERHLEVLAELLAHDPRKSSAAEDLARHLVTAASGDAVAELRREEILAWLGPDAAAPLVEAVASGSVSAGAVRAAGASGDARLVNPLTRLLEHAEPGLRAAAATALGRLADTRAVMPLLGATRDSHWPVRTAAAEALNAMGMAAVVVGIAGLLRSGSEMLETEEDAPRLGEAGWVEEAMTRLLSRGGDLA